MIKYNKRLLNIFNITKDDFNDYKLLTEFNEKFNVHMDDIDITELELNHIYNLEQNGIKYLYEIKFKNIIALPINNNISDIMFL